MAIAPTTYALLQKAQPTFAAIEQSFSMLSKLLKRTEILISKMSKNTCSCITINYSGNCVVRCLLKNRKGSDTYCISYVCFWQFFYAQPVGRMAFFSAFCCHASLGCRFYKIRTSKRHIKPKYVKLKYSQRLLIIKLEIIFQIKIQMALVTCFCYHLFYSEVK